MVKWWWRLKMQPSSLWCKIICGLHNLEGRPHDQIAKKSTAGVWNNIAGVGKALVSKDLDFNRLFEISNQSVHDSNACWKCKITSDGRYTVAALRKVIDHNPMVDTPSVVLWRKEVPAKVLCFVWRAAAGCIPTAEALEQRGICIPNPICKACGHAREEADHVLINCPLAAKVWTDIWRWCNVQAPVISSIEELLVFVGEWGGCTKRRFMLNAICCGVLWCLWKARNDLVFNSKLSSSSRVMEDIISLVFLWFTHRGKMGNCNWVLRCIFPFDCL